jgi:hypothetical protein
MAIEYFLIRQGDTKPLLIATLKDANGVIDLSTASNAHFHMKDARGGALDAPAVIASGIGGQVRYDWAVGDTANKGDYEAEFLINWAGGAIQRVPNNKEDKLIVRIYEKLA